MKKELIFNLWNAHTDYLANKSVALNKGEISITKLMANFFCPGPYFFYVLDSPTLNFDFVSESMHEILGIKPTEFTMQKLIERIHPDDFKCVLRCEDVVAYFLKNEIHPLQIVNYKIVYTFRIKAMDGTFKLFLLQTLTLKTTETGALLKVLGSLTDISHITNVNNYRLSFIGLNGNASFLELDVMHKKPFVDFTPKITFDKQENYTNREFEIICLIGKGKTTKEITALLNISQQTVLTHRKNILKKSDFKTTTELIANFVKKGYL